MLLNTALAMKTPDDTPQLTAPELYTGEDGRARFRERPLPLAEGTPMTRLSALAPSSGWQFRRSPVGFASDVHCTTAPQWLVVLQGQMEIGLPHDARACSVRASFSIRTTRCRRAPCSTRACTAIPAAC